jgi:hypothetical protein
MVVWSALHSKLPVFSASPLSQMPRSCDAMLRTELPPCLYITTLLQSFLFNFIEMALAEDTLCPLLPFREFTLEDHGVLGLKIALPWRC